MEKYLRYEVKILLLISWSMLWHTLSIWFLRKRCPISPKAQVLQGKLEYGGTWSIHSPWALCLCGSGWQMAHYTPVKQQKSDTWQDQQRRFYCLLWPLRPAWDKMWFSSMAPVSSFSFPCTITFSLQISSLVRFYFKFHFLSFKVYL